MAAAKPGRGNAGGEGSDAPRLALTTAPELASAERIARELVGQGVAACVNLLPGVRSIYRWKGAVEDTEEVLLVMKTVAGREQELERLLALHHPYEVPELVFLDPARVEAKYLAWLRAQTAPGRGAPESA